MKYSTKQYAASLFAALQGQTEAKQKEIVGNFLEILTKNSDWAKLNMVVAQIEKQFLEKNGLDKICVELADEAPQGLQNEIERILGKKTYFLTKANPSLLAGLKILINDELLIDASARKQIDNMFREKLFGNKIF